MYLKQASACLVAANRRLVRTTNGSQRDNRCFNVNRSIIDDASDEITAK